MTTVYEAHAGKLFVVDAHRADVRGRYVVRSDELLEASRQADFRGSRIRA